MNPPMRTPTETKIITVVGDVNGFHKEVNKEIRRLREDCECFDVTYSTSGETKRGVNYVPSGELVVTRYTAFITLYEERE
ncbi:hypothetical protein [Bacillus thuringiensis]|uniref:hypothetical protein n=1 Tax=Bacillus thuringiensis TaxID=1428 RepID=UPI000BFD6A9F|nr:hypothetical protein [Bacillus thuringiensis]PGT89798.1 hypothetical protein COD17_08590 [Bacillus thuringiensis]